MKRTYWGKRTLAEADALLTESILHSHRRLQKTYLSTAKYCIDQLEQIYIKIQNSGNPDQITRNMIYTYQGYYEKLQLCYDKLDKLGVKTVDGLSRNLTDLYVDNTKFINSTTLKPLGINISMGGIDKRAEQASQAIWAADGKSWSERLWGDTARLKSTLQEVVPRVMMSGQGVMQLTYELQKEFSVSFDKAKRLATTELTHIYATSAQATY